jgi:hypothetical protein
MKCNNDSFLFFLGHYAIPVDKLIVILLGMICIRTFVKFVLLLGL